MGVVQLQFWHAYVINKCGVVVKPTNIPDILQCIFGKLSGVLSNQTVWGPSDLILFTRLLTLLLYPMTLHI